MEFEGVNLSAQQKLGYDRAVQGVAANAHIEISIHGELDPARLKQAVEQLVVRHDVLRHQYVEAVGLVYPLQGEQAEGTIDWQQKTLSGDMAAEVAGLNASTEITGAASGVRCLLLSTTATEHSLFIQLPPLMLDDYSARELVAQLSAFYQQDLDAAELNEDTTQYGAFVVWLDELLQDEDAVEHQNFYRSLALSEQPSGELPYRRNPEHQHHTGMDYSLSGELKAQLEALAENIDLDMERLLLSGWAALLARLNDRSSFLVNWHHDCRYDYEELSESLGLFKKALPLAVKADLQVSCADFLQQMTALTDDYLEAQEYWSANDKLSVDSRLPAFEYCVERALVSEGGPDFELINHQDLIDAELHLQVTEQAQGLQLHLTWLSDCYSNPEMQALLAQFEALLQSMATDSEQPLQACSLANAVDPQLRLSRDAEAVSFDCDNLLSRICQQMAAQGDAIALQSYDRQYSYAELDQLSSKLAQALIAAGAARKPVALFLPRGIESVVAIVGSWKAGSAYLPMDTGWPQSRCDRILADADVQVVITLSDIDFDGAVQRVDLDTLPEMAAPAAELAQPDADDLAYLLYTSGSTGEPKGVRVSHGNLCNYTLAASAQMELAQYRSFALTSTLAADLGNTMLFAALANGACLHVLSQDEVTDAQAFSRYLQRHPVEVFKFVPSHLETLASETGTAAALPTGALIFGGEATDMALVQQIRTLAPQLAIYNHYGPTETTVGVMFHRYDAQASYGRTLPLDAVIANNQVVLINAAGETAAVGEKAELYVSGANVTQGYLNNQQATDDAFVSLAQAPGQRFYRTGDLARYSANGRIELIGRQDHQIKVRGFRLELAEIELALRECDQVQQAAVAVHGEGNTQQLHAFLVLQGEGADTAAIKAQLATLLPAYMIPQHLHPIEALPLLPNGKVDRAALPSPQELPVMRGECLAPADEVEEILLAIWKNVLGVEELGVNWDFFEMGGHSLMAIKVVSRIRKILHVDLPPGIMFEHSNIRALAQAAVEFEAKPGQMLAVARARKQLAMKQQNEAVES